MGARLAESWIYWLGFGPAGAIGLNQPRFRYVSSVLFRYVSYLVLR